MISTHVPSLELCKKLSDLGWKKETMFWWNLQCFIKPFLMHGKSGYAAEVLIPAPTVGEIGLVLPDNLDEIVRSSISELNDDLYFSWCNTDHPFYNADLLAETLIWMIESNLVKLEEETTHDEE